MLIFPNSKINLGLTVLDKRPDGYHNISSVFYPVPYRDVIEVLPVEENQDKFIYSGLTIPSSSNGNLCEKAIRLLRAKFDFPAISVHLHKVIAMGAGLGGGSSDATYLLKAIRDQFKLDISNEELENISLEIGSDCPFFIENTPVTVSGRGEVFESCGLDLTGCFIVLVTSEVHISTSKAYANIQRIASELSPAEIVSNYPMEKWKHHLFNDFEGYAFDQFPELEKTKMDLYQLGAVYASMTGSGSAVYGIFKSPIEESVLKKAFGQRYWSTTL